VTTIAHNPRLTRLRPVVIIVLVILILTLALGA
jgi:hypothetical protein